MCARVVGTFASVVATARRRQAHRGTPGITVSAARYRTSRNSNQRARKATQKSALSAASRRKPRQTWRAHWEHHLSATGSRQTARHPSEACTVRIWCAWRARAGAPESARHCSPAASASAPKNFDVTGCQWKVCVIGRDATSCGSGVRPTSFATHMHRRGHSRARGRRAELAF